MKGSHCIKTWSSTQKSVTLSSAEAEFVAMVKMSTEILGLLQLCDDWGCKFKGRVCVDSSAALGVVKRKGNGKLRHIKVGMLWVQEKRETGELKYNKVRGTENPADLMTKNLAGAVVQKYMKAMGFTKEEGRAEKSLEL